MYSNIEVSGIYLQEHSRASRVLEHSSIGCTYTAYTHRVLVCNLRTDTIGQRERHNLDISISIYIYMSPSSSDASWSDASWSDDDLEQSATLSLSLSPPLLPAFSTKKWSHIWTQKGRNLLPTTNRHNFANSIIVRERERERESTVAWKQVVSISKGETYCKQQFATILRTQ